MEKETYQKKYRHYYKQKITEMTEKIESPAMLKRIYQLAEYLYIHRKSGISVK